MKTISKLMLKLGPATLLLVAVNCGHKEEASDVKRVAFDHNGDGQYSMLTLDSIGILEARVCNAQPPVNANCAVIATSPSATVQTGVAATYASAIAAFNFQMSSEVIQLRENDPQTLQVKSDLASLAQQSSAKALAISSAQSQLATANAALSHANDVYNDLVNQLQVIFQKLSSTPTDQTLLAMQTQVDADRANALAVRDAKNAAVQALSAQVTSLSGDQTLLQQQISAKNSQLTTLRASLPVSSALTVSLAAQIAATTVKKDVELAKVIAMIKEPVLIYKDSVLSAVEKDVAQDIFNAIKTPVLSAEVLGIRIDSSGLLQVLNANEWRGVCDDNFNAAAAKVACNQLHLPSANPSVSSMFGGTFWLDGFNCNGAESSLFACQQTVAAGTSDCGASENVHLVCQ